MHGEPSGSPCFVRQSGRVRFAKMDPFTAYLAASPDGVGAMAIIASSSGGNMSFFMSAQITRFIVVMLTVPALATFLAQKIDKGPARE